MVEIVKHNCKDYLKERTEYNELYTNNQRFLDWVCLKCGSIWGLKCGRQIFKTNLSLTYEELIEFKKVEGVRCDIE